MPKPIQYPWQLKGGTFRYKNKTVHVRDYYVLHGQVVLQTDNGDIKINKSTMKEEIATFKRENGKKSRVNHVLGKKQDLDPARATDPPVDEYYSTRDYGKFVTVTKNRVINKAHVSNLVDSIEMNNLLFAQPILVNERYEVIDGQHRLEAARRIGCQIFYIMKKGLAIEDAIALNVNTKNWGYKDYLHYWIEEGDEHYVYFADYLDTYGISYSVAAGLIYLGEATSGNKITKVFNNGDFKAVQKEYAEKIGKLILKLAEFGSFANDRSFIIALDKAIKFGGFDTDTFLSKLSMCPDKFTKCSDTDSYLRMMEDVINYHGRGQRIRLY